MASSQAAEGSPFQEDTVDFLNKLYALLIQEACIKGTDPQAKVVEFQQPEAINKVINFEIEKTGANHEELLEEVRKVIKYSMNTGHPRFMNNQFSGKDPYGLAGAFVTEALNTSQNRFESSPVFTMTEKYMINKLNRYTGFTEGDGVFTPGATLGTCIAVHMARYKLDSSFKTRGLFSSVPLVLFASEGAHFCLRMAASFLCFGFDNCVAVKTDEKGRMCPKALEKEILARKQMGHHPLLVMASAGTTVLGAFDPINEIADITQKYNMWLHIDGAWGAPVLLSEKYKYKLDGVNRADSMLWNAHKLLGTPFQCSVLLVKQKGLLDACNSIHASFIHQPDKMYDNTYDLCNKTVQCGRKADAFKWWLQWKAHGDEGMKYIVEKAFDNAGYMLREVKKREGFRVVLTEYDCTNICFWYIPPSMRGQEESKEWWDKLGKVAPLIKSRMALTGTMLIAYTPYEFKNLPNFFRPVLENPQVEYKDIDFILDEIDKLGQDL